MRSQKQTNKAPRPHQSQSSARRWSGGHAGLIPPPKFPLKAKHPAVPLTPATDKAAKGGTNPSHHSGANGAE